MTGGDEGRDWDLRCFCWSAGGRRSRSRGAWRACCCRWRLQSWPPLWESPRCRTSPRPEVTTASVTNVHRGGATSVTSTWKHWSSCCYAASGLSTHHNLMSPSSAKRSGAAVTVYNRLSFLTSCLHLMHPSTPCESPTCSCGCYSRLMRLWR